MNGTRSKRDTTLGKQRLTLSEEKVLVQKVLELDHRGIPLRLDTLRDFASSITQARGVPPVGHAHTKRLRRHRGKASAAATS